MDRGMVLVTDGRGQNLKANGGKAEPLPPTGRAVSVSRCFIGSRGLLKSAQNSDCGKPGVTGLS